MSEQTAREVVAQTPLLHGIERVESLDEGYSDDEKFILWQDGQPLYLLRLSPLEYQERRRTDIAIMAMLFEAGIRCPRPFLSGTTRDGMKFYSLLSYLAGLNGERSVPALAADTQYDVGKASGTELRRLHHFKHPKQSDDWPSRRLKKYQREVSEPKSAKSRRQIVLNSDVVEALRRHRIKQNQDRLQAGPAWQDMDLVFANEAGRPVEVSNLTYRYFRPLLLKAGLPKIRFHDLRHTAATLMLGAHVDVKVVSEILGHSQAAFTMDRYQHVTWAMQQEAAQAVSALLRPSTQK